MLAEPLADPASGVLVEDRNYAKQPIVLPVGNNENGICVPLCRNAPSNELACIPIAVRKGWSLQPLGNSPDRHKNYRNCELQIKPQEQARMMARSTLVIPPKVARRIRRPCAGRCWQVRSLDLLGAVDPWRRNVALALLRDLRGFGNDQPRAGALRILKGIEGVGTLPLAARLRVRGAITTRFL